MFPYWLIFSIFTAGAIQHRGYFVAGRSTKLLLLMAAFLTAILIGFRYEVGPDWIPYRYIFHSAANVDLAKVLLAGDPGYNLLNWTVQRLGLDIWAVNLVCGAIFVWGLVRFAQIQPNPWLAIAVAVPYLVVVVAMSHTRQATAIGFLFLGLVSLSRGSFLRFLLWMALAATFHASALVMIPIAGLSYARNRFETVLLTGAALAIGYMFLSSNFDIYAERYADQTIQSEGTAWRLVLNAIPALLFLGFRNRFGAAPHELPFWRNLALIALLSFAIFFVISSSTALDRLALYVMPLQIFVFSRVPFAFPDRGRANGQAALVLLLYSGLILFVYLNFSNYGQYFVPYRLFPVGSAINALP